MKSSEKLKLKRKVPANKSNSRFSKGHFWENKMCQNSITCQSKLSFWVSKIKIQLAAKVLGHLAVYGVKWPFSRGRGR